MDFDLDSNSQRAIFIATVNAALNHLGLLTLPFIARTANRINAVRRWPDHQEKYGLVWEGIVGYQPSIIAGCVQELGKGLIRVTDMDTKNLGMSRFGIEIWDGVTRTDELIAKSDILLITGTTFVNGTAFDLLAKAAGKPVYFYGTTVAGAAALMGYRRLCLYGKA